MSVIQRTHSRSCHLYKLGQFTSIQMERESVTVALWPCRFGEQFRCLLDLSLSSVNL